MYDCSESGHITSRILTNHGPETSCSNCSKILVSNAPIEITFDKDEMTALVNALFSAVNKATKSYQMTKAFNDEVKLAHRMDALLNAMPMTSAEAGSRFEENGASAL
jgi:hypothetical protein